MKALQMKIDQTSVRHHILPMAYSDCFLTFLVEKDDQQMDLWKMYSNHLFSMGIGVYHQNDEWGIIQGELELLWQHRWIPGQGMLLAMLSEADVCRCEKIYIIKENEWFPETEKNHVLQLEFYNQELLKEILARCCGESWLKNQEINLIETTLCLLLWVGHSKTRCGLTNLDPPLLWENAPELNESPSLPGIVHFVDEEEKSILSDLLGERINRASMCMLGVLGVEKSGAVPVLDPDNMREHPQNGVWLSFSPFGPDADRRTLEKLVSRLDQKYLKMNDGTINWNNENRRGQCGLHLVSSKVLLEMMTEQLGNEGEETAISCAGPDLDWDVWNHVNRLKKWLKTSPQGDLYVAILLVDMQ